MNYFPEEKNESLEKNLEVAFKDCGKDIYKAMEIVLLAQKYGYKEKANELYEEVLKQLNAPRIGEFNGWWMQNFGDLDASLNLLENAYHEMSSDPLILKRYGETLRRLGRNQDAIEIFKKSLLYLENFETRFFYGQALAAAEDWAGAEQQFKSCALVKTFSY